MYGGTRHSSPRAYQRARAVPVPLLRYPDSDICESPLSLFATTPLHYTAVDSPVPRLHQRLSPVRSSASAPQATMGDKKSDKKSDKKGHKSSRTHVPIAPLPRKVAVPVGSKGQVWVPLNPSGGGEAMQHFEQDVSAAAANRDAQASGSGSTSGQQQQQQQAGGSSGGGSIDVSHPGTAGVGRTAADPCPLPQYSYLAPPSW